MAVGGLAAVVIIFVRIGSPADLWETVYRGQWGWVTLALALSLLTSIPFAAAFIGTVPHRLAFWPVVGLQVAMGFSNVTLPAGAESAVQVRYLQKNGIDLTSAVAVGGVYSTVSEFVVQSAIFGVAVLLAPTAVNVGKVPVGSVIAAAVAIAIGIGITASVVLGVRHVRVRVGPHLTRAARSTLDAMRSPRRIALLIGGNVVAQVMYATALLCCLRAFGTGASLWTLLALQVGISVIAGLVPIPGLDTAVSTLSMSGALVAVGVDGSAAAAAVVTNTLVVSYLPAIPGWWATNSLVRRGQL
ncbi:MAG: lysylphosphatidylglycerol synthase domain-containing protein [Acidimicrobiia bacterium]